MKMLQKIGLLGVALSTGMAWSGQACADTVAVQASTPYAANSQVRDKIKQECQLDTKLPAFVQEFAKADGIKVELKSGKLKPGKGKVLLLEITDVVAPGGGVWSGSKSMSVAGKLYDNGKLIGDFSGRRYSGGGFWGGYKGTCSIIGRCSKTLGKDIAKWLKHPTRGAHLGDN